MVTVDEPERTAPNETVRAGELDEFLARAVDRQVAEHRALRETLAALTEAVNALRPPPSLDPEDLSDRMLAATRSAIDPVVTEIRVLSDNVLTSVQRATAATEAPEAGELSELRGSVGRLSSDIEGIAQALIDLNAGLRDWATGVDEKIADVGDAVEQVRELASRTRAPAPAASTHPDIDQRMKETIELSLYLADQIEEFDKVLGEISDLPQRLEGVVSQGMRRTLAASAKLEREASTAIDETLVSLDDSIDRMSETLARFGESEETLRKLGLGQAELASRLAAVSEAVHELAEGRSARAAGLTKAKPTKKATRDAGRKPGTRSTSKTTKRGTKRAAPKADDVSTD